MPAPRLGHHFTLPQDALAEITLVDRNHLRLLRPLLHEVVSGVIHPRLIMTPIRRILRGKRINFLRARVDAMPEVPSVYVLGDAAHARHPETGEVYPPTAQVAYRQTVVAAVNIAADTQGGSHQAFDFTYIGDLVSLGRLSGVADPFGIKLRGTFAWAMWKLYYLLNLVGWQNGCEWHSTGCWRCCSRPTAPSPSNARRSAPRRCACREPPARLFQTGAASTQPK